LRSLGLGAKVRRPSSLHWTAPSYANPFGLQPCPPDNDCPSQAGSVFTLTFGGAGSTPLVGANFEFGVAIDNKLSAVGFARAGQTVGIGVTAGFQAEVQKGSINDLLRPRREGGDLV